MYLVKFAYDGTKFHGFSAEKGKRTVQGEIVSVLSRFNISDRVYPSSRTDRNVSALGNVIGIKSSENMEKIAGILNSSVQDMLFYAFAYVDDSFKPRHAGERWYRYFLLDKNYDLDRMLENAKNLVGEHDFSGFSRRDERNPVRRIKSIEIKKDGYFYIIDIRGESFLWNMVRRMVGFIAGGEGDPFSQGSRFTMPAENLILMDVMYNIPFFPLRIRKDFSALYSRLRTSTFLYEKFLEIQEGRWGIEPQ